MLATEYLEETVLFDGTLSKEAVVIAKGIEIDNMIQFAEAYASDIKNGDFTGSAEEYYYYLQSKK